MSRLIPLNTTSPFRIRTCLLLTLPQTLKNRKFYSVRLGIRIILDADTQTVIKGSHMCVSVLLSSSSKGQRITVRYRKGTSRKHTKSNLHSTSHVATLRTVNCSMLLLACERVSSRSEFHTIIGTMYEVLSTRCHSGDSSRRETRALLQSRLFIS